MFGAGGAAAAQGAAGAGAVGGVVSEPDAIFGADLLAWFRADTVVTSGSDITEATDKTGGGYHFTGASGAEPQLVTAFGQPAFDFDGVDQRFSADHRGTLGAGLTTPWGQYLICQVGTAQVNDRMLNNTNGATHVQTMDSTGVPRFKGTNGTTDMRTKPVVYLVYDDGTDSYIYIDGVLEATLLGVSAGPGASLWGFGARGSDGAAATDMTAGEAAYINGAITSLQIADLQAYAEDRYSGL